MSLWPGPRHPTLRPTGPVLLFGGCYSNLQATRALLGEARRLGIASDHIVCTGDVVAYCADPAASVDLLRAADVHVIKGNCEDSLGAGGSDCGCGFSPGSSCDRLSASWYAHADAALADAARRWMAARPARIDLAVGGRRLAVVHGSPARTNEFVFPSAPDAVLRQHIRSVEVDGVIGGHCGIPFTRIVDGSLWHNPGAIGMPANDGTPRVWFSILAAHEGDIEVRHRALAYDHRAAAEAVRRAGLPDGYADALESGLWPSLDVLPEAERAATGKPLAPAATMWRGAPAFAGP